jgi:hypothetical protein
VDRRGVDLEGVEELTWRGSEESGHGGSNRVPPSGGEPRLGGRGQGQTS